MKSVVLAVFALACTWPLTGQITTSQKRTPDGATMLLIRNIGTVPIEAFAVKYRFAVSGEAKQEYSIVYVDALVDHFPAIERGDAIVKDKAPLLPNAEYSIIPAYTVPRHQKAVMPAVETTVVTAGILADGTPVGDGELVGRMILRRCHLLQAVETALEMLTEAGRRNVARERVTADFKRMASTLHRWYLPQEARTGLRVYQPIVGKLINLPEGALGEAFPPTVFVEQETAMLNRQRVALLGSQPGLGESAR